MPRKRRTGVLRTADDQEVWVSVLDQENLVRVSGPNGTVDIPLDELLEKREGGPLADQTQ